MYYLFLKEEFWKMFLSSLEIKRIIANENEMKFVSYICV